MTSQSSLTATDAYTALAPAYDAMTASYDYDDWLTKIERVVARFRPRGTKALDVACGTGSSFLPLCERGYDVTACDASPAMLSRARARAESRRARVLRADMRRLPELGSFDLVLCLDDSINHLLTGDDVSDTLAGVTANLAPEGVFVFDVNTLATIREGFSSAWRHEDDAQIVTWCGQSSPELPRGGLAEARVEVVAKSSGERRAAILRERHHPLDEVHERLRAAGLTPVAAFGQQEGIRLQPDADELRHRKGLFFAMRRDAAAAR